MGIGFNKEPESKVNQVIVKPCENMHIDSQLLFARLKKAIDDKEELSNGIKGIKYRFLSDVIGDDIQKTINYSRLVTARRKLQRDTGVSTEAIHNIGIKFLVKGIDITSSVKKDIDSVHRKSRRGLTKLSGTYDTDSLTNSERIKHNAYCSALGALAVMTSRKKIDRLESVCSNEQTSLPLNKTLEAFKK